MTENTNQAWKALTEEIEVAGHQLVAEIHRLLAEGNVRKLVITSEKGDVVLSVPLSGGAVAGGMVALAAPWLAVIAAIAGVLAKVRSVGVRNEPAAAAAKDANQQAP
jgi:hypothetical protein